MIDLIRREDVFKALGITDKSTKYGGDHSGYNTLMLYEIMDAVDSIPNAETTGALDDAIQEYIKDGYILAEPNEYVKDGTLTVQMPTIKEAKAIDKIVVYSDTYKQEYHKPRVGKWIPCEERMPKAFENPVLVSGYKGYVSLGWWNGKEFETATRLPHIDVIAWQPLPEPYEMERSE